MLRHLWVPLDRPKFLTGTAAHEIDLLIAAMEDPVLYTGKSDFPLLLQARRTLWAARLQLRDLAEYAIAFRGENSRETKSAITTMVGKHDESALPLLESIKNNVNAHTEIREFAKSWIEKLENKAASSPSISPVLSTVKSDAIPPVKKPEPSDSIPPVKKPKPSDSKPPAKKPESSDSHPPVRKSDPSDSTPPRVFISYSHDSEDHRARVLSLTQELRRDNIDAWIDQFEDAPAAGWPRWMLSMIEKADYVIIVGTPAYKRRFEGKEETNVGRGAGWEGLAVAQALYESSGNNSKVLPILFTGSSEECIPSILRPYESFRLPEDYERLRGVISGLPKVIPAPLGGRS